MRVGVGYDSHRFDPGVPLILGGVRIPGERGLTGHSDGDVIAHAIIDALLGAAALGSIGGQFPDTDPAYAGADSLDLLETTGRLIGERGHRVVNVDVTVIAEGPRIAPYASRMAECIGSRLQIQPARVSIKGKTNEKMGWIGRGEGVAAVAVALLEDTRDTRSQAGG